MLIWMLLDVHTMLILQTRLGSVMVQAQAQPQSANDGVSVAGVTSFKHVLLPIIMDRNPYLSEATRQVGPPSYHVNIVPLCFILFFLF